MQVGKEGQVLLWHRFPPPAKTSARERCEFRQDLLQLVLSSFKDEHSLLHPPDEAQPKYRSKDCLELKVKTEEV